MSGMTHKTIRGYERAGFENAVIMAFKNGVINASMTRREMAAILTRELQPGNSLSKYLEIGDRKITGSPIDYARKHSSKVSKLMPINDCKKVSVKGVQATLDLSDKLSANDLTNIKRFLTKSMHINERFEALEGMLGRHDAILAAIGASEGNNCQTAITGKFDLHKFVSKIREQNASVAEPVQG